MSEEPQTETTPPTKQNKPKGACPAATCSAPLSCCVEGGKLTIAIGIETLAWAALHENGGPLASCRVESGLEEEWAADVAREIANEDEIGNTMLTEMLDSAMSAAVDNGSAAVIYQPNRSIDPTEGSDNP